MMTVNTAREVCRFGLALVTILMLWNAVTGIRNGGVAALFKTRGHRACSANAGAQAGMPQPQASGPHTVRR